MLPSLRVTSPPHTHTPTSKFNASQSSCQQVAQGVKAHLCSQWGLGTKMDQNMPSPSNWTLWDRQSQDQYRAVVCMSHPWKKCHHLPSGTGLGGGCPWVGEHPLVFSANLTVRVKITPAASFSKIKGDAIENVCRCIQTQMGTSVFNCKWVRTEQMRFPLYLGSKNYRENVPEAETNQPPNTHTHSHTNGGVGYWDRSHMGGNLWHPEGWSSFGFNLWGMESALTLRGPKVTKVLMG